jgi:transcriptional regulator with XRE-family HTH domain
MYATFRQAPGNYFMAHPEIDVQLLEKLLRSRRKAANLSLRDAADQIGISAATLQRVEAGQVPNTAGLIQIVKWLGISMEDLYPQRKSSGMESGTVAKIEVHLRADPHLDPTAAQAIAEAVQKLYAAYSSQPRRT